MIVLTKTVKVGRDHLIHRKRSPFPYEGKALSARDSGRDLQYPAGRSLSPAWGWVGGVYPSAHLKARTAASDGHCAFTLAARSAGLRFAVILLSKAVDVGRDHLIHRKRSPFPYEGKALTPPKLERGFPCRAPLLPIAYCLLPFNNRAPRSLVPGHSSNSTLHSSLSTLDFMV